MTDEAGIYSPSDDSEGPVLRDFVNETLAHEVQDSPRSELLSSQAAPEPRPRRGPSQRYRRERESAYRSLDHRQTVNLLIEHEYETSKIRKTLYLVLAQLEAETQRATEAEKQANTYRDRFQRLNETKVAAERESHTLEEELTLYKIQYDLAQKEILKARETVHALQSQVDVAEQVARKARGDARKVKEALEVWKAREEGRKQGFEAGWNRAREEFGIQGAIGANDYPPFQPSNARAVDEDTMSYQTYPPPNQRALLQFPEIPVVPGPIPPRDPLPAMPEPISKQSPSTRPFMPTPAVETYSLPIPSPDEVEFDNRPPPARRASPRQRPQQQSQTWNPDPPVQRAPSPRPPDNFIPAVSDDGHIALPPPHELAEYPSSPQPSINALPNNNAYSSRAPNIDEGHRREYTLSKGKARATDSWYNQAGEVDSKTHIPLESTSTSWYQAKPDDSTRSRRTSINSRYSTANSSGGLLDAWGVPIENEPKRSAGIGSMVKNIFRGGKGKDRTLSIIKEDPLSRQGSLNVGPTAPPFNDRSFGTPTVPYLQSSRGPIDVNQRSADELRYDNPDTIERQRSIHPVQDIPSRDRYPRNVRVPHRLTVPAPLSPPAQQQHGHGRAMSVGSNTSSSFYHSGPTRTASENSTRPPTEGGYHQPSSQSTIRASRRTHSMSGPPPDPSSPPVSISVQPPSQSPSDAPGGLNSATRLGPGTPSQQYLSPNGNPVVPLPNSASTSLSQGTHSPARPPSLPYGTRSPGYSDHASHRIGLSHSQTLDDHGRADSFSTLRNMYPEPSPNLYDRPASTLQHGNRSSNSTPQRNTHKRSESLGVAETPNSFRTHQGLPKPSKGHLRSESVEGGTEPSPLKRVTSNLSVRSAGSQYSHFDPETYRDPAFFVADTDAQYQPRAESRTSQQR